MHTVIVLHGEQTKQYYYRKKQIYQCVWSYFANTSAKLFSIVSSKNFKVDIGIASIFSKF